MANKGGERVAAGSGDIKQMDIMCGVISAGSRLQPFSVFFGARATSQIVCKRQHISEHFVQATRQKSRMYVFGAAEDTVIVASVNRPEVRLSCSGNGDHVQGSGPQTPNAVYADGCGPRRKGRARSKR